MKMATRKNIHDLSKGPPNPGFIQEKVQKGDFLKKDSRELIFFSCFRFLWISQRSGTLNWERVVFLLSKIIYRKCEQQRWHSFWEIFLWLCCNGDRHGIPENPRENPDLGRVGFHIRKFQVSQVRHEKTRKFWVKSGFRVSGFCTL